MKKTLLLTFLSSCFLIKGQTFNAGTLYSTYNDIIPDTLLNYTIVPTSNEKYRVDLFDDTNADLEFTANGMVTAGGADAYIRVASLNPNLFILFGRWDSVYVTGDATWKVTQIAKPLNLTDPINPVNAVWEYGVLYLTDHSGYNGGNKNVNDWIGSDKYLGIKYQNGTSTGYGWIRVRCKTKDSCSVKGLSHSPAGVGIKESGLNQTVIYPNPIHDVFYLNEINVNTFDPSKLKLTDMLGKEINCASGIKDNSIKIEPDQILPGGCYTLRYFSDDNLITKKLIRSN